MTGVPHRMFQDRFTLPPDASELVLVRHGSPEPETVGDFFPLLYGRHSDPPLSTRGKQQAEAVARRLASEKIGALFVSTLRRTAETAEPLARATGLSPVAVDDLRETGLGTWESGEFERRVLAGDPLVGVVFTQRRWDVLPEAEPATDFRARVTRGLATVVAALEPGGSVVAYVHGGVVDEICSLAVGSLPFTFVFCENASITRLIRLPDKRWRLRTFNDVAHLDD